MVEPVHVTIKDPCQLAKFSGAITDGPECTLQKISTESWIQAPDLFAV